MSVVRQARADALLMVDSAMFNTIQKRITELALQYRLPAISRSTGFAQAGGLFQYGENPGEMARRAAVYVDKILKGAKPANLPIEQPTKFELVIKLPARRGQQGLRVRGVAGQGPRHRRHPGDPQAVGAPTSQSRIFGFSSRG